MRYKKAELTSKQLITIIILIISFAIILAFFLMLDIGGETDKEICRNSVAMRDIPFGKFVISLKCKTQDICLSVGGNCESGVDNTIKVENKEELITEMTNLLDDCWWMMGEGKVDYGDIGDCAICYKVYFDNEAKRLGEITFNQEKIDFSEKYAIVTGIIDVNPGTFKISKEGHFSPVFIRFDSDKLRSKGCSKYITEV